MTNQTKQHDQPDIMAIINWLQGMDNQQECLAVTTRLIDQVRTDLLPELAAVRRSSAWRARIELVEQGMSVAEATRVLADEVGASPQTIMRLITEKGAYGG